MAAVIPNHNITFGDVFWQGFRSATGYTKEELVDMRHKELSELKPVLETLDLADIAWTDRPTLQRLRDDLDLSLQCRRAFLEEKTKRANRKFTTRNYLEDKKYEAAQERDRHSHIELVDVLARFKRIDFTGRTIKSVDADTVAHMCEVQEIVLTDNNIDVLTALPPRATLAILASNDIHRVQLQQPHSSLMAVSLSGNCLSSLSFVGQLPNLSALDASFNCISTVEAAACAEVLAHKRLAELSLVGNPAALHPDFRSKAEAALRPSSSLKVLDGVPLSSSASASNNYNNNTTGAGAAAEQQQSKLAMNFQVYGVRGFSDLTQKSFDFQTAASQVVQRFYSQSILDAIAFQNSVQQPVTQSSKSKAAAAAAAASSAASSPSNKASYEQALQAWGAQVQKSLRVQALWMGGDRQLQLDELMQAIADGANPTALLDSIAAAKLQAEQQEALLLLQEQQGGANNNSAPGNTTSATASKSKDKHHHGSKSTSHQSRGGGAGGGGAGGGGGGSNKSVEQKEAKKEEQLVSALNAASADFELPKARATLTREVMLPLRLGIVFAVSSAPGMSEEELPVATVGWASLSPADIVCSSSSSSGNNHNCVNVTAKVGVDRATLLTARERVQKLTLQLDVIRTSLEKEIAENAWRRDTEFASTTATKGGGGGGGGAGGRSRQTGAAGNARGARGSNNNQQAAANDSIVGSPLGHGGGPPPNADPNIEQFFQSQQLGRKRAEETYKRLALEMAVLSVLEALEQHAFGSMHVDARFTLSKKVLVAAGGGANGSSNGGGDGAGGNGSGGAGGVMGGAGDGKSGADGKVRDDGGKGGRATKQPTTTKKRR